MGARFHRLFYLQNRRMIIGNCHKKDIERRFRINELTSNVPYAVRSVLWNDSEASFFSGHFGHYDEPAIRDVELCESSCPKSPISRLLPIIIIKKKQPK